MSNFNIYQCKQKSRASGVIFILGKRGGSSPLGPMAMDWGLDLAMPYPDFKDIGKCYMAYFQKSPHAEGIAAVPDLPWFARYLKTCVILTRQRKNAGKIQCPHFD